MKNLALLAALAMIPACTGDPVSPTLNVTMAFSNAGGFGTQNAGDFQPGSMFIWNTSTNEMQFIDTLGLRLREAEILPGNRSSTSVAGIGISGIPASLQGSEGLVEASLSARSSFSAAGAYRQDYRNVETALSQYVADMIARGADPNLLFRPRDPLYRVVVIRSVLRAQDSGLSIGGADASNPNSIAEVKLNSPIGEIASVNVRAGSSTTCGAPAGTEPESRPVCFFNVVVYKPTYVADNPRLQWDPNAGYPADELPAAFRGLR
ncbi:MAG: hypothetical protein OEM24_03800 [Paracoccaceae bacterium]|nr:hypothetical protein [Paracoccaceae bacterium]